MYHGREEEEKEKQKFICKKEAKGLSIFFLGGGDHGRPIQCTGYIK